MKKQIVLLFTLVLGLASCHNNLQLPEEVLVKTDGAENLHDFYITKYNITRDEYLRSINMKSLDDYLTENMPDYLLMKKMKSPKHPWNFSHLVFVCTYANRLSKQKKLTPCYEIENHRVIGFNVNANGYRIPSEDEWDFAYKGGIKSKNFKFAGSDNLDEVAWCKTNHDGNFHEVGLLKPNELGIYDMEGNVAEWTWDEYIKLPKTLTLEKASKLDKQTLMDLLNDVSDDFPAYLNQDKFYAAKLDRLFELHIVIDEKYLRRNTYRSIKSYQAPDYLDDVCNGKTYASDHYQCGHGVGIRLVRNVK